MCPYITVGRMGICGRLRRMNTGMPPSGPKEASQLRGPKGGEKLLYGFCRAG
jgi:hypothetical protein